MAAREELGKTDLLQLVFCPLMGGQMSQKERVSAVYDITRSAIADAEVIRNVEAAVYIMAEKFLDFDEMAQIREEIKMTKLGKMIYEDGIAEGRNLIFKLIQCMTEDGVLELIPRLTTDSDFLNEMLKKYNIE